MDIAALIANIMLVVGVIIFALAVVGLFKFTDVYQRISAVGTAAALGMSLLVIGAFILVPSWLNFVLMLVILGLQIATSSIGTMAIARSAYLTGAKMQPGYFDQLADDQSVPEAEVGTDPDLGNDPSYDSKTPGSNT